MIAQQTRIMATEKMISENEQRIISNESRIMGQESVPPPQTVELYEGSDDPLEDETQQNIANKLGCEGAGGYIDTIVNFDEKEGELNISNVVKIGDQVIRKEWDCGKEYRETIEKHRSASRNLSRSSKRFKNETFEMNDSFDGSRMTVSRKIFDEDQSVEPNPTVERKTFNRHKFKHNVENCDCDLCQQDEEVFWETSRPLSHRRSSLKRSRRDTSRESAYEESVSRTSPLKKSASKEHTRKSWDLDRSHKRASLKRRSQSFANLNETSFGEEATPPRRSSNRSRGSHSRSSLKKSGRASSANRKSVSFKELVDEDFRPNYSLYSTQRKPLKRSTKSSRKSSRKSSSVHSPSFGANNSVVDDTCDFEELEFVDSIPTEGKKSLLRNSGFSATKDKTSRGTHSFFSPNNGLSLANLEHNYRMTEIKNPKRISSTIKHPRQGSMTVHMPPSYDSLKTIQRGSRDNARTRSMKQIALRLVKYGELQQFENSIKNTL